jgi:hypothetical protein
LISALCFLSEFGCLKVQVVQCHWLVIGVVLLCFVKPKNKERFKWWTFTRYQNPRIRTPSFQRTEVLVVLIKGGTGDFGKEITHWPPYLKYKGLVGGTQESLSPFYPFILFFKGRKLFFSNFLMIRKNP